MKSLFCQCLRRSYRHCFDKCLHSQSLSFHSERWTIQLLFSSKYHSTRYSNSWMSASVSPLLGKFYNSSNASKRMVTQRSRKLSHLRSPFLHTNMHIHNTSIIIRKGFCTSTLKSDSNDKDFLRSSKYSTDRNVISDRYIYVKTLDSLYEDVSQGIILDTAYGDSRPDDDFDPSMPVVMALHDTPGSHRDVVPFLSFFAKLGCRTLCPTFPGHGETRGIMRNFDDIFSQVTMERAAFVHDFLSNVGINRVDVLIGVGASSYTAMALCTQMSEVYKSMALISPWPHTKPRFEIDSKMLGYIHDLWEMVYFRPVARLLLPAFKIGNAVNTEEKMAACYLIQNLDLGEADGFALTAALTNVPRLVAYGGKDDLVGEEAYADILSKLGIDSKQVVSDHQRGPSKGNGNQPKALRFPDAGYNILTQHRGLLCAHILQLLQQFHPSVRI